MVGGTVNTRTGIGKMFYWKEKEEEEGRRSRYKKMDKEGEMLGGFVEERC